MVIQHAKRQGWEQGSKQGLEEGIRGGGMEGPPPRPSRWNRGKPCHAGAPNTQKPNAQKRTRQRESKVLLLLLLLLRPKLTYTLQKNERVQVKCRSSLEILTGWMSM